MKCDIAFIFSPCFEVYLIELLMPNSTAKLFELCDVYDLNAETARLFHVSSVATCKPNIFTEYYAYL